MTTQICDAEIDVPESVTFTDIVFVNCDFQVGEDAVITLGKGTHVRRCVFRFPWTEDDRTVVLAGPENEITDSKFVAE